MKRKRHYHGFYRIRRKQPIGLRRKKHGMDREDARVIPIIAMTANAFTEDRIRAKEAGMDEHILGSE